MLSVNPVSHSVDWLRSGRQETRLYGPASSFWCVGEALILRSIRAQPAGLVGGCTVYPSGWALGTEGPCPPEAGTRDLEEVPWLLATLASTPTPRRTGLLAFLSLPIQAQVTEVREAWAPRLTSRKIQSQSSPLVFAYGLSGRKALRCSLSCASLQALPWADWLFSALLIRGMTSPRSFTGFVSREQPQKTCQWMSMPAHVTGHVNLKISISSVE